MNTVIVILETLAVIAACVLLALALVFAGTGAAAPAVGRSGVLALAWAALRVHMVG